MLAVPPELDGLPEGAADEAQELMSITVAAAMDTAATLRNLWDMDMELNLSTLNDSE